MRFLVFILLTMTSRVVGQSLPATSTCHPEFDTLTQQDVYRTSDTMPAPHGGLQALSKEISKKIKYPHIDRHPIESRVVVGFIVQENGEITGKRILKNIEGTDIANQLLDIIDDIEWEPGLCQGKRIPVLQFFPVIIDFDK